MVNKDHQITGEIFSGQLKGNSYLNWKVDETATLSGIGQSTINYWMGLPLPVFLFVADLKTSDVYFCAAKHYVRQHYRAFLAQKSLGFTVARIPLGTENGKKTFDAQYLREKHFNHFQNYIRDSLVRWKKNWDFIQENQMRDFFLEVEGDRLLEFNQLYHTVNFLAVTLGVEWNIDDLVDAYKKDREEWKDGCDLHEATLAHLLRQIQPIYITVLEKVVEFVAIDEWEYWSVSDPTLWRFALNNRNIGANLRRLAN
jgi:hypothetical protein